MSEADKSLNDGGVPTPTKHIRDKLSGIIIVALVSVLLVVGTFSWVALDNLKEVAETAAIDGIDDIAREYLTNYTHSTAARQDVVHERFLDELEILASLMQQLIDHPELGEEIAASLAAEPDFASPLEYTSPFEGTSRDGKQVPMGGWAQSPLKQHNEQLSVVSVWGYLLDGSHQPKPHVQRAVEQSVAMDLVSGGILSTGTQKLQVYYVGSREYPIMRTAPHAMQAQTFDELYPGHNDPKPLFWEFFFPGIFDDWEQHIESGGDWQDERTIIATLPYLDAIRDEYIVTFFYPLWNKERTAPEGTVAMDITLIQLGEMIPDVKLAETGFAFLATAKGNVIAINPEGEDILGLEAKKQDNAGVKQVERRFDKSRFLDVRNFRIPEQEDIESLYINGKKYMVATTPLAELQVWESPLTRTVHPEKWIIGMVVAESELLDSLDTVRSEIDKKRSDLIWTLAGVAAVLLLVLGWGTRQFAHSITNGLVVLAEGAKRIGQKDYSARVEIKSNDEVGVLAHVFNDMMSQIQSYTEELESKVQERTRNLRLAQTEILSLNDRLKEENVRLGAEVDVARRLQMMVLPEPEELASVPTLDIAGFMEPADEVGGDYYDVLRGEGLVKVGMGDVTGHGLESGVVMLMVQSVARTLLETGKYSPKAFLALLNRVLCHNMKRIKSDRTLTLCFLDILSESVVLTGQHEEVIIRRGNGQLERIDTVDLGFPVGLETEISDFIATVNIPFEVGDTLILYTDGITEAESDAGKELFGMERLCESLLRHGDGTATEICDGIIGDVKTFIGTQKIHDDITLLVLRHM